MFYFSELEMKLKGKTYMCTGSVDYFLNKGEPPIIVKSGGGEPGCPPYLEHVEVHLEEAKDDNETEADKSTTYQLEKLFVTYFEENPEDIVEQHEE